MQRQFAPSIRVTAVLLGALCVARVQALGLDEIQVSSNLNQRFVASIPLTEVTAEDLETVTASVAPNEAFERAGIERAEYLTSLDFQIKNDQGQPRVVITSNQIAREPVLSLLVQARWRGGKILRDYTILLDPIEMAAAPAAAVPTPVVAPAAPVVAPAPVSASVVSAPESTKPKFAPIIASSEAFYQPAEEPKPALTSKPTSSAATTPVIAVPAAQTAFDSATGSYGPVAAKETLWGIAVKVRPSAKVSMDQVVLALAEANPLVIQHGTTVNKAAMLKVPSAERMLATTATEATKRLADLRAGQAMPVPSKPDAAPQVSVAKPVAPQPAKLQAKPPEQTAPALPAATQNTQSAAPAAAVVAAPVVPAPIVAVVPTEKPAGAATPPPAVVQTAPVAVADAVVATAPALVSEAVPAPASLAQRLPDEALDSGDAGELYMPLALAIGVLLLAMAAFVLARRRSKASTLTQKFTDFAAPGSAPKNPGNTATPFGDTAAFTATQTLSMRTAQAEDATQQITQQMGRQSTQKVEAQGTDFGATLVLDTQTMASLKDSAKASAVDGKTADTSFDRTTQVDVDTLHIDLNDNDPLAEADFHLAYGLYDEAILLLQTAVSQNPGRVELQAKLAETYFTAGRAIEFQEVAAGLHSKLAPAEWGKIAIMGAQICPDVALFKSATDSAMVTDTDFDLAFDEPVPEPTPEVEAPKSQDASVIDFDIADAAPQMPEPALPEVQSSEKSLDFMLSELSSPVSVGDNSAADKNVIEFDLNSPALDIDIPELSTPQSQQPKKDFGGLDTDSLGFDLQELEFSLTANDASGGPGGNDINTKLDLARAYVEMGDNDMARNLLHEVQLQGSESQQQEAASLLQRLPA